MTEDGGCLEAQVETKITITAYLEEGQASAQLEENQGLSAAIEPTINWEGRLGRCWQEEAP